MRRLGEVFRNTVSVPVHGPEVKLSRGISLICRPSEPIHRDDVIAGNAFAFLVHFAEVVLRRTKTMSSSLSEQGQSSTVILRHSLAVLVHGTSAELRLRYASRGCRLKPLGGKPKIALHSHSEEEHHGEIVLGMGIARSSSFREPSKGFVRVFLHNFALRKCDADPRLSSPVAIFGLSQ